MSSLLLPGSQQLNRLFHLMVVFAVLGPTLGVQVPWGTSDPWLNVTFFRATFFLLVAGLVIRWVNEHSLESSHMYPVRWFTAFFAFWILYATVSLTWVADLYKGLRYSAFLLIMLSLCLSFPLFIKNHLNMENTSKVLFGVFFILVVFGLSESVFLWHLPVSRYYEQNVPYPTSFFTNQNDFATTITLGLPFLVTALYMIPMRRRNKGLIYTTGIIALSCLLITGSRSNSGFALPLITISWLISIFFTVERTKLRRHFLKGVGWVFLGILLVAVLSSTLISPQIRDKLGTTMGVIQNLQKDWQLQQDGDVVESGDPAPEGKSISIRKALIINGLRFLHHSNYLGVGAGNIEYFMEGAPNVYNKTNIHNWWAEILVNFGVLVFTLYMCLYIWLLHRLWRLARITNTGLSPVIRWGATASLIALIGYVFGAMSPSTAIHFTPMWIVYGFALAVVAVGEREQERVAKAEGST
ncbi:O-antigen ligase family protein [Melghirimyces algeriensis]|uniref:O-Antigen ligase n=1 Tax=Melghirimyces algeriensis TaxID=910412 RepID=A0A521D4H4_9BACL|nr:O-antigen ligase family protein [Melghirimyces algeriensis]SMO66584.1 O-Antigen ligase [Melghirimyces algeriensis]